MRERPSKCGSFNISQNDNNSFNISPRRSNIGRSASSKYIPSPVPASSKDSKRAGADKNVEDLTRVTRMYNRKIDRKDAAKLAILSRIIVLGLQLLAVEFLPIHENDGFKVKRDEEEDQKFLDPVLNFFLKGFTSWDGQYFLHIATYGYTEENAMAFFPLFPSLVSMLTGMSHLILFPLVTFSSLAILVGFLLNLYFFVKSAENIYCLAPYFDRGMENLTVIAVLLYCFNPASIFFSAFYSESLFSLLTSSMLLALFERRRKEAFLYATLSSVCRSNGVLNLGFIFIIGLRDAVVHLRKNGSQGSYKFLLSVILNLGICAAGLIPFLGFQIFCYRRFCHEEYVYPAKIPDFCIGSSPQLPYQYIQSHNWNVGFLKYFELKQLPNFVLAGPVLFTLAHQCYPRLMKYIQIIMKEKNLSCLPSVSVVAHGAFLTVFCFTAMHVQVSTRLIFSSCPYLTVFIAKSLRTEIYEFRTGRRNSLPQSLFIYGWFLLYFIVGSLLFSAGYPWT